MSKINKRFWKPSLTSQFDVCPIPFHLDTYRGCVFDCRYCFARDFTTFARRNTNNGFTYLECNNPELFKNWISKAMTSPYDYSKGEEVAVKERIPLKIGATADPCPPIEKTEKITYDILKVLHSYDYPTEIQTKNPKILISHAKDFINPNWTIAITIITMDKKFANIVEPNAPSPKDRMKAIKKLTSMGLNVMVKIQPCFYPKIIDDLPDLIKAIKMSGCWAFNTEGLKVRVSMPKSEQLIFKEMSKHLGYDIRRQYHREKRTGSDFELALHKKMEYTNMANDLAKKYDLKYFSADNEMGCIGCGCGAECCGTEVLRNYKIYGNNLRNFNFAPTNNFSTEIGKCLVNFKRSQTNANKTIDEVMKKKMFYAKRKRDGWNIYDTN